VSLKQIAIVGTAPHRAEAPFTDKDWTIWACSPGNMDLPRFETFFEPHDMDELKRDGTLRDPYLSWLKTDHKKLVWTDKAYDWIPNCVPLPKGKLVEEFGEFFFTSTPAYMMAMAILQSPERIGVYGIDMATDEEYLYQRPGMQFFLHECEKRKIEVLLPESSHLRVRYRHYGEAHGRTEIALLERLKVLQSRMEQKKTEHAAVVRDINALDGAIATLEDIMTAAVGLTPALRKAYYLAQERQSGAQT
jgi:hypothetical protein